MTVTALAKHTGVGRGRLSEIMHGIRRITTDTAIRLSLALATSARFWLNVQLAKGLYVARQSANSVNRRKIKLIRGAM